MRNLFSLWPIILALTITAQETPTTTWQEQSQPDRLQFGGWMDLLYSNTDHGADDSYFDLPHIYAYADAHFSDRWRGFMEMRRVNAPGSKEDTGFERLYLEYRHGIPLKIRVGRFNTPAGLWQHMHWAYTIDSTEKPLIEQKHFFPTESDGIQIFGTLVNGMSEVEYSVFGTYQGENNTFNSSNEMGYGFDLNVNLWERSKTGLFFQNFQFEGQKLDPNPGTRQTILAYNETQLIPMKLLWRTEYLYLDRDEADSLSGYYSKLRYNFNARWFLNYRYDDTDIPEPNQQIRKQHANTLTLGFHATSFLRLRAEVSQSKTELETETTTSSIWIGYRF